ncbi:MAG TPA: 3-hexulose-6-phosphate synthase [Candidatus Thermoplasmatota archaeon]|nr:3-hexulose-6-phosphate synthase [Candidatus Thermoplasmatota archaeon]
MAKTAKASSPVRKPSPPATPRPTVRAGAATPSPPAQRWPVLQIALDEVNLDRAVQYAREAVAGGCDWVEAGTPLIKACGLDAVRVLKKEFPGHVIVADMKTMDTGAFETEMAVKAGADVVGILGAAADGTFREAVKSARKYGARIYMDLIGVKDKVRRAKQAQELGCDYVALHIGVDEQMEGGSPLDTLKAVVQAVTIPVMVAGGLTTETVGACVKAGAAILVVGGALTKAPAIEAEARRLKAAIRDRSALPSDSFKRYGQDDLVAAFRRCSTSNVSDAMHRKGAMAGIEARQQGARIAGRAVTVFTADGDWAKPVEAIEAAQAGEVLVIDVRGGWTAVWGELASHSCQVRGIAGIVVDGAIRDVDDIRAMGFPAWSRHVVPNAGEPKGFGEIGAEVRCGGQAVRTGDWIVADDMGVVVVPQEEAREVANRSVEVHEREDRLREEIRRGRTLSSVLSLKKWEKVVG